MHRIDATDSVAGLFSDGDPLIPRQGTVLDAAWGNGVQENLCQFIEAAGIALVKGDHTQLRDAVDAFIAAHNAVTNPHSATASPTASRLVLRDASGRAQFADPSAAQDAATKAYVDGAAVTFAAGANWTLSGISAVRIAGKVVTFTLKLTAAAGAAWDAIGTFPAGSRPAEQAYYPMGLLYDSSAAKRYTAQFAAGTGGVLGVNYYDDGTSLVLPPAIGAGDEIIVSGAFIAA
jgi:hypothetical protein